MMGRIKRIINIRFKLDGLNFDAAVDPDWDLHAYEMSIEDKETKTPIEVYCFDRPEWDILMIYQTKKDTNCSGSVNEQQENYPNHQFGITLHTSCNFDKIIEETKKWIEKNKD